jgi:hypothetical protein
MLVTEMSEDIVGRQRTARRSAAEVVDSQIQKNLLAQAVLRGDLW